MYVLFSQLSAWRRAGSWLQCLMYPFVLGEQKHSVSVWKWNCDCEVQIQALSSHNVPAAGSYANLSTHTQCCTEGWGSALQDSDPMPSFSAPPADVKTLTSPSPEGLYRQDGLQWVQGAVHGSKQLEAELHDVWPGPEWNCWTSRDDSGNRRDGWES